MEFRSYVMLAMSAALAVLVSYNSPAMADDASNPDQPVPPSEILQSYPNDANIGALQSAENTKPYGSADYNAAMGEQQGFPDTATGDDDY